MIVFIGTSCIEGSYKPFYFSLEVPFDFLVYEHRGQSHSDVRPTGYIA